MPRRSSQAAHRRPAEAAPIAVAPAVSRESAATGEAGQAPEGPAAAGGRLRDSLTVRRFAVAVLLMLAVIATFHAVRRVELSGPSPHKLIDSSLEASMRFTGLAHFVIGFLFLVTSDRMASPRSRAQIGAAVLVGTGLCALFGAAGGAAAYPPLPGLAVVLYFLVHELRDERYFYLTYGEAPERLSARGIHPHVLVGAALALVVVAAAWTVPFVSAYEAARYRTLIDVLAFRGPESLLLWGLPVLALLGCATGLMALAPRRSDLTLRGLFANDRPLWIVYLGVATVAVVGALLGGRGHAIVLLHVAAWWVFATAGLARSGKRQGLRELGLLDWFRRTQRGFQTLHVGLTVLAFGLGLVWVYGLGKTDAGLVAAIIRPESFYYWTILHVTVSFVPRPGG